MELKHRGNNLHRVVIFRDNAEKANQVVPFSSFDSDNPENLWRVLEAYEQKTGGSVLAIPHNGNLSNGRMFEIVDFAGNPLTRKYAETRSKWEPLVEATQMKGDGETHPYLSPNDEFAGFERWDRGNLDLSTDKKPEMLQYEYARSALKLGLKLESELGVNPYKFGSDRKHGLAHLVWLPLIRIIFLASSRPMSHRPTAGNTPPAFLAAKPIMAGSLLRLATPACGLPQIPAKLCGTR